MQLANYTFQSVGCLSHQKILKIQQNATYKLHLLATKLLDINIEKENLLNISNTI
jgi:hypothetical protein